MITGHFIVAKAGEDTYVCNGNSLSGNWPHKSIFTEYTNIDNSHMHLLYLIRII